MKLKQTSPSAFGRVISQLGSNSFLEPISLTIMVLPITVIASVAIAEPSPPEDFLYWFIANLLAIGLLVPIILGWRRYLKSRSERFVLPLPTTILVAAAVSLFKTLMTVWSASWFMNLDTFDDSLAQRLLSGTLVGTAALLVTSACVLLLQEFQAEQLLLLTAKAKFPTPILRFSESRKFLRLADGISGVVSSIKQGDKTPRLMEARLLRDLIERYVRPLSSSLFSEHKGSYQSFTARDLFHSALRGDPPSIALGLQYIFALPRNVESLGMVPGTIHTALAMLLIAISTYLMSKFASYFHLRVPGIYLINVSLVPVGIIWFLVATLTPTYQFSAPIIFILVLWYLQSGIVFGMARVALDAAAKNRRAVENLVELKDNELAKAMLYRNRKLMANQMHGEVQSRLMNLILKSESGAELESEYLVLELETIQQLIRTINEEPKSLKDSINQLVESWSGFIELTIDVDSPTVPEDKEEIVFVLIQEAVSNAVRHGLANQITVKLERPNLLVVTDNGMGPTAGRPGLGSTLLSAGTSHWSLIPQEMGGTRLEAWLNLS